MQGIDETIAPLIEAMNQLPYIDTLSCCGGHPEESAVKEYGYAVATVVFDIEDEAENAIRWYGVVQDVLRRRQAQRLPREHAFGIVTVGAVFGALNLAHYFVSTRLPDIETPFGLFPGGFPVAAFLGLTGRRLSPELVAMLALGLGIAAGSALSARVSGELTLAKFRSKKLSKSRAAQAAAGGVLMGAGVWMAQGCLIKHTLSGAPGLMVSSFLALAGMVIGMWACAKIAERT